MKNQKIYFNRLMKLAVPLILSNIIAELQMLIDRIFLGHMDSLYMSALGNVNSPMWTTMSFCFSLVTGASILISQGVGAGNTEKTEEYAAAMIKWNNIIPIFLWLFWTFFAENVFRAMGVSESVLPMCLGYVKYYAPIFLVMGLGASLSVILQTSNYTKPLAVYGAVRSGLNIVLDWALIFGHLGLPEMGIQGAALATTIAEYVGGIFMLTVIISNRKLKTKPSMKSVLKASIRPYLQSARLGVNTALEDFAWNFGNLMLIRILNAIDEMAAGIYSIVFSVEVLVMVVVASVGSGTMTLTGEATGRRDLEQYKAISKIAYVISGLLSAVMLVISIIIPDKLVALFTADEAVIATGSPFLIFVCLNMFAKSANIIIGNAIRGSGNTRWMFMTQGFGTVFIVACSALMVFGFHMGIAGVFVAVLTDEAVRALINLWKYISITKKWKNGSEVVSE